MTSDVYLNELEQLLSETVEECQTREASAFDTAAGERRKRVVLFGAGNWGQRFARSLRKEGTEPLAFADNNRDLWGKEIEGVRVMSPQEAADSFRDDAAFVISISNGYNSLDDHVAQLKALGCGCVVPGMFMAWKYADAVLPHMWHNLPSATVACRDEVLAAYRTMSEDASRKEFVGQIRWRLTADTSGLSKGPFSDPESYFPPEVLDPIPEEVLLDGGAFTGDTLQDFLERCPDFRGRLVAFEPDPANRARLLEFQNGLPAETAARMVVVPKGLWNREEVLRFTADGTMNAFINPDGDIEVPTVDIDSTCRDLSVAPTFIKMDIQGAEPLAMEGGKAMIAAHKPVLAISVYHRFDDIWTIPNLSKSLNPDYHITLWPRMHEGWEMVMFGLPPERVKSDAGAATA